MTTKTKARILYAVWLCLYILCVGLGTVEKITGIGKVFFVLTALIFFIPGALLLVLGKEEKRKKTVLHVRIIAICSLVLTVAAFCGNVLAVGASPEIGALMHEIMNIVSAPMFCAQYWILSLFGWACLLSASFMKKK